MNANSRKHDPRNNETRRVGAMGGDTRSAAAKLWIEPKEQVKDKTTLELFCTDICRGTPGRYPIFGFGLKVEMLPGENEEFPAVVSYGTVTGHELEDMIRQGFYVGVNSLFRDPKNVIWKSDQEKLLTLYLLSQPEFQLALAVVRKEHNEMRARQREEEKALQMAREAKRRDVLARLEATVVGAPMIVSVKEAAPPQTPVKVSVPKGTPQLGSLIEIQTARTGFSQLDGLTIFVGNGPHESVVVRVRDVPEGHELFEIAANQIMVKQEALAYAGDLIDSPEQTGNKLLSQKLRSWLRTRLVEAGAPLLPAEIAVERQQVNVVAPVTPEADQAVKPNADLENLVGRVAGGMLPSDNPGRSTPAKAKRGLSKEPRAITCSKAATGQAEATAAM